MLCGGSDDKVAKTRTGTRDEDNELLISHMIFADNCYILASNRMMLLEMARSATEKIIQGDLEWKTNEMQYACWAQCSGRNVSWNSPLHGVNYKISMVQEMRVMGSLLSNEAGAMSAMRHRMNRAMSAIRVEMYFYKNNGIPDSGKHQASLLHTSETWSWTTELATRCMALRTDAWM